MSFTESSHSSAKNRKVMAFGTFDILHPGHIYYLSQARGYAEELIIIIARDQRVIAKKGRPPVYDESMRKIAVEKAFPEAKVVLGDEDDILAPIRLYNPDILAFGYDQQVPIQKLKSLFPTLEIVRIPGYEVEKWKSSKLREYL